MPTRISAVVITTLVSLLFVTMIPIDNKVIIFSLYTCEINHCSFSHLETLSRLPLNIVFYKG